MAVRPCRKLLGKLGIARLLTWCSADCASFVRLRNPKTVMETTKLIQEFDHIQGEDRRQQQRSRPAEDKHRLRDNQGYERSSRQRKSAGSGSESSWVPTCFTCGIKGHKADQCPKRSKHAKPYNETKVQVKRVVIPTPQPHPIVMGKVGNVPCPIFIDSGANVSMVHSSLVQPSQILDENVRVGYADGPTKLCKVASVWVYVDAFSIPIKAAMVDDLTDLFILGRDAGDAYASLMIKAVKEPARCVQKNL